MTVFMDAARRESNRVLFVDRMHREPAGTLEMLAAAIVDRAIATVPRGPRTLVTISVDNDILECLRRYHGDVQQARAEPKRRRG